MKKLVYTVDDKLFVTDNKIFTFLEARPPAPTLWLRADAGVEADGDNLVGEWQDQSGNGYDVTQTTPGNQPQYIANELNGKPVLRFSGGKRLLGSIDSSDQPNTLVVVWKITDGGSARFAVSFGDFNTSPRNSFRYFNGVRINAATDLTTSESDPFDSYLLHTSYFNGSSSQIYRNGVLQVTGNSGALGSGNSVVVGAGNSGGSFSLVGDIAEIIFYNSLVSDPQRQSIEQYLISKYGL